MQHIMCVTTDGGSNELACRKAIAVLCKDIPNFWYFECTCLEHAHHLVCMGGLKLIDKLLKSHGGRSWKYYSSIAIFTNVSRSCAKDLYHVWCNLFGATSALERAKKLFPKCCSTRWGSIHVSEEMIIKAGCAPLKEALTYVIGEKQGKMSSKREKVVNSREENDLNPDTLAIEAIQAFQLQMGKWRKHALAVLGDRIFQPLMKIMHRLREPVMRLSYFLKSKLSQQQIQLHGNHLSLLVNGKMQEIFDMFGELARYLPFRTVLFSALRLSGCVRLLF